MGGLKSQRRKVAGGLLWQALAEPSFDGNAWGRRPFEALVESQKFLEIEVAPERNDDASLQERDYRDEKGEVHVHTKFYVKHDGMRSAVAGDGWSNGQGSRKRIENGSRTASGHDRLAGLFLVGLDMYSAEKQMLRVMWSLGGQIQSDQLRQVLEMHGEETGTSGGAARAGV